MLTLLPDRILSDGVLDNRVAVPVFLWEDFEEENASTAGVSEARFAEILSAGLPEEEELAEFLAKLPEARGLHIEGITLTPECTAVREIYESLGYFREAVNRFEVDFTTAPITLGCFFENLFSDKNGFPQRHTGHQKSLRKALNSGVISTLSFRKTDETYLKKAIAKLIASEEFSLFRLGRILSYNKEEIWAQKKEQDVAPFRKWITLELPKIPV